MPDEDKPILVIISADIEWQMAAEYYHAQELQGLIFNSWFDREIDGKKIIFYHGGWGKISAAATCQYAIERWQPDVVLNLGTCGGVSGLVQSCDVILANETLVYDIYERMGDAQAAINYYRTPIDLSWLRTPFPIKVHQTRLISADRDIDPREISSIMDHFDACAADWESGAIAWVAARNHTRCLILRGVSDVVDESAGEVYGNFDLFKGRTSGIMTHLLDSLAGWIEVMR